LIKHLKYNQIDFEKWDSCISKSLNSFAFAYSWYLDIISEAWEALVENDYERVMPLTFDYKLNYQYIYQPILAPQLGIFSPTPLNSPDIIKFIENIPQKFKHIEINLNKFNTIDNINLNISKKSVYSLDLIESYDKIVKNYSFEVQKNISEIKVQKFFISNGLSPNEIINFLKKNNHSTIETNYDIIRKIISYTLNRKFSKVYSVYNFESKLVGIAFFLISNYNVNLLTLAVDNNEFKNNITAYLLDNFINEHSEKSITLNIEANTFPNITSIFKGLGAQEFFYQTINISRVPRIFRFFIRKKI